MDTEQLKKSLINLRESLSDSQTLDPETLALARNLESDIEQLVSAPNPDDTIHSSLDLAVALEAKFESEHPLASRLVREIIDALHKMGI